MKKCNGCGAFLQAQNKELEGYTTNIENTLCERCFRINHYNEYQVIDKDNSMFIDILKHINNTNDLVVLLVDVFNIPKDISIMTQYLSNDILLVYTKKDILPLKISDEKILNYNLNINVIDKLVISSLKNYNFDLLNELINKYKKSKNVYIVGFTNAGKSTLINKFMKNYSLNKSDITVSNLPSTTLNTLELQVSDDLVLIDTPGIIDKGNIINYLDSKLIKKIIPKKEIKPITYQIHKTSYIYIEDIFVLESSNNDLTFYISNSLKIEKKYKKIDNNLNEQTIRVKDKQDIVIPGLGFIRVSKPEVIKIETLKNIDIYTRDNLI